MTFANRPVMLKNSFILLCACLMCMQAVAQNDKKPRRGSRILDDTTKLIYNAKTTRYLYEKNLLENRKISFPADTSLDNFHEYNFVSRSGYKIVDLGNIGSATRPLFYQLPSTLGTRLGMDVFEAYAPNPDSIKYYDTRSPFSRLYYVQGGKNQQIIRMEFVRNVNPRWNVGAEALNFSTERPYGFLNGQSQGSFANRASIHWSAIFKTRYFNKDSTYQVAGYFSHLNHFVREQGGLKPQFTNNVNTDNVNQDNLLKYKEGLAQLEGANARDFRNTWHVYQQYKLAQGFQVFHSLTREKRNNNFTDYVLRTNADSTFYKYPLTTEKALFTGILIPGATTVLGDTLSHNIISTLFENKIGIKGKFNRFDYRIFARNRTFTARYEYADLTQKSSENFLGIALDYQFSNRADLHAEAEYLLFKDYRLEGTYVNRFFRLQFQHYYYSPSLLQRQTKILRPFQNFLFSWDNDFTPTTADVLTGSIFYQTPNAFVSPFAKVTNLSSYIYFDSNATPQQASGLIQLLQIGLQLKSRIGRFATDGEVIFSTVTGADVLRVPSLSGNVKLYYENTILKANQVQLGVQVQYKSSYYGNFYMPITGQFYLQDKGNSNAFELMAYPAVDLFASIRIKSVRLFGKFTQANQGFPANGYFTTPYYAAIPRTFGLGVTWLFFD